jgi:hypothetical protein
VGDKRPLARACCSEWPRRRRASPPCAPTGPGGRAGDEHPTPAYGIVGAEEVRLGVTAVREVRGIEQELAAAMPRLGSREKNYRACGQSQERRRFHQRNQAC